VGGCSGSNSAAWDAESGSPNLGTDEADCSANGILLTGTVTTTGDGSTSLLGRYTALVCMMVGTTGIYGTAPLDIAASTTTTASCTPSSLNVGFSSTCTATVAGYSDSVSGETVTLSQSGGTGSVSFSGTCTLSSAGTCNEGITGTLAGGVTLTASYVGDADSAASSGNTPLTVSPVATGTTVDCSPSPVTAASSTLCTARVTGFSPSGSVSWSTSGSGMFASGTCALSSGSCSDSYTPSTNASPVTITATYGGDANNLGSFGSSPLTVTAATSSTSVSCTPSTITTVGSTTCTATVTGSLPTGTVTFSSSSGSGVFSPTNGQCTLASGSCSVTYHDSSPGLTTVTATYSGDSVNSPGSGTFSVLVETPPPPPTGAEICQRQVSGGCFTSFIAFNVTSGGKVVDATVTIVRQHGPAQTGTTEVGTPLQMATYDISILDTVACIVTLPNGHIVTATVSNPDPWTVKVVNISG